MNTWFQRSAVFASAAVGSATAFLIACLSVVVWALFGPVMHYSDTWQLLINTGTDVATFLIVFLIQYAQNRDTRAIRLKLDELLRTAHGARPAIIDLDQLSDDEITQLENEFQRWRDVHAARVHSITD